MLNARKPSGVKNGAITLRSTAKGLAMINADKGRLFDFVAHADRPTGLKSLQYRAKELNGGFIFRLRPAKGVLSSPCRITSLVNTYRKFHEQRPLTCNCPTR